MRVQQCVPRIQRVLRDMLHPFLAIALDKMDLTGPLRQLPLFFRFGQHFRHLGIGKNWIVVALKMLLQQ